LEGGVKYEDNWYAVGPRPAVLDTCVRRRPKQEMAHEVPVVVVGYSALTDRYLIEYGRYRYLYIVDGDRVTFKRAP
jgi:hypothetical protein